MMSPMLQKMRVRSFEMRPTGDRRERSRLMVRGDAERSKVFSGQALEVLIAAMCFIRPIFLIPGKRVKSYTSAQAHIISVLIRHGFQHPQSFPQHPILLPQSPACLLRVRKGIEKCGGLETMFFLKRPDVGSHCIPNGGSSSSTNSRSHTTAYARGGCAPRESSPSGA